jgi:hypothetical protein
MKASHILIGAGLGTVALLLLTKTSEASQTPPPGPVLPTPLPPLSPLVPFLPSAPTAIVLFSPGLEAHALPDDSSQRLILPNTSPGDRVTVLGRFPSIPNQQHHLGWVQIRTTDGSSGFAPIEQLSQIS